MKIRCAVLGLALVLAVGGCKSVDSHRDEVRNSDEKLTAGKVQREIRVGMTGAEVAEVLGSPNLVSTDAERREVWVYDKIATETAYSTSSGGVNALVLGGVGVGSGGLLGSLLGGSFNSATGAASTNQRTLTVVVKFDNESRVRDFSYRQSSF